MLVFLCINGHPHSSYFQWCDIRSNNLIDGSARPPDYIRIEMWMIFRIAVCSLYDKHGIFCSTSVHCRELHYFQRDNVRIEVVLGLVGLTKPSVNAVSWYCILFNATQTRIMQVVTFKEAPARSAKTFANSSFKKI